MRDCSFKAFDACQCLPGECQSAARPIIEIEQRHEAKRRAGKAMGWLAVTLTASVLAASFIFIAIPESQRLARANQETLHVQR